MLPGIGMRSAWFHRLEVPRVFLEPVIEPLAEIVQKFAKSHGPFAPSEMLDWYGIGVPSLTKTLAELCAVAAGHFT